MSAKEDRPEYCQRRQDDFAEFERAHYGRRGVKKYRPRFYPPEKVKPFDLETAAGWRASAYTMDGHTERIFTRSPRVAPTASGPKIMVDDPHRGRLPLTLEMTATCGHECWPIPHPDCGCGIYCSPSHRESAQVVRVAANPGGWDTRRLHAHRQLIAYPVALTNLYVRQDRLAASIGWPRELIAAQVKIAGPILTTSTEAARDLQARGFNAEHVADTPDGLAVHLEALAVTT